jgi:eukaryotic-like serine/threonine-protein kinase
MIGEKLGKYTIQEVIGTGSMGTVYKAEDPEGQTVAIKLIRSQILYNMERRERFLQCALIASETRHKAICPILEIGDDNDDFFIIMPFVSGKTLEQYMGKKPIPWAKAFDIALEAGAALQAIHKAGTVHRGLKPANVWILNDREHSVLLSDCCIARFTEIGDCGRRGRNPISGLDFADTLIPLGALAYMSPEQVRGEPVDCRTDVFSLGVILYEMLSGRHPFESRNPLSQISAILEGEAPPLSHKQTDIPTGINSILRQALSKAPESRPQNMDELLAAIQTVRNPASVGAPAASREPMGLRSMLTKILHRFS